MRIIGKYLFNILIGFDTFLNSVIGGSPYETISSRYGRLTHNTWLCNALNIFEKNHCEKSAERRKERIINEFKKILAKDKITFQIIQEKKINNSSYYNKDYTAKYFNWE